MPAKKRPASPIALKAPELEIVVRHELYGSREVPLVPDDEDEATGVMISATVTMDGEGRTFRLKRGYRRGGVIARHVDDLTAMLDKSTWPEFVALVNQLDAATKRVSAAQF